jgi:hypothetical protein
MAERADGSLVELGTAEVTNGDAATGIVEVPGGKLAVLRAPDGGVAATAVWGWIGLVASAAVAVAGSLVRRTARRDADHAAPIRTRPEPVATAPR